MTNHEMPTVRTELDSHADMCVVGRDTALLILDHNRPVQVHGYSKRVGATTAKTVSAVVAYDHPGIKRRLMLIIHQALLLPHMTTNLLTPNQLRRNELAVNDEPKHLVAEPTEDHHAIVLPSHAMTTEDGGPVRIPLLLHGVTSYFPTTVPTKDEYDNSDPQDHVELTYELPAWEPDDPTAEQAEQNMLNGNGQIRDSIRQDGTTARTISIINCIYRRQEELEPDSFGQSLQQKYGTQSREVKAVRVGKALPPVSAIDLAKRWAIGIDAAERTVKATTQTAVRTTLHSTLSRRYPTNDRQLRYRRLPCDVFTDTLESKTVSWRRRTRYAQVFATRYGWVRVFPMQHKSDAHEALSLFLRRHGSPITMIMDNAREQTMGDFRSKARQAGITIKQTEPHSPWQNAAEAAIREVKRGAGRKMRRMNCPTRLWDHCLELEALIRSHTALKIYELQGEVPETVLSGQTADISPFIEHGWYDWVMFYDSIAAYPEPKKKLGRWLGPVTDIGPAMTSKVLKANGQVAHLSSSQPFTAKERASDAHKKLRDQFDDAIAERLGKPSSMNCVNDDDDDALDSTPDYDPYSDDDQPATQQPDEDDLPTPEAQDTYVGARVNLPVGGTMRTGIVKSRARDSDGNISG